MIDIEKIGKLSKTFFKTEEMSAKHVIDLMGYMGKDQKGNGLSKTTLFSYDVTDRNTHEIKRAYSINSTDCIMLTNNNKNKFYNTNSQSNKEGNNDLKGGAFIYITPKDFDKVTTCLDKCVAWLCEEEFAKLFTVDVQGNTIGVSDNNEATVARFQHGWLLFKPAVVFDKNGAGYQGIYIKTDRGVLASLTGTEFVEFSNFMKEIMKNFYVAGNTLYTACMISILFKKE